MSTPHQVRRNPIFNNNKFKLGTFATNTIGSVQSNAPDAYSPSWENSLRFAKIADRAGFEAILGLARWKTPAKTPLTHRGNFVLDSFTWAAALAMATEHVALFSTSHAPTVHPLVIAKQCATIDHVSGGRFGLNVVGGWNRHEFDMFGLKLLEHDLRYDYLTEWMSVMRKLWGATEEFDFEGTFLKLKGALSMPQPVQKPHPPIMDAAMSGRGRRFACEYADCCFVSTEVSKSDLADYKKIAREEFGRDIGIWMQIPIVQRRTRQEAEDHLNYIAVEHEDRAAVDGWSKGVAAETRTVSNEAAKIERLVHAMGGRPVAGSAVDIADELERLSERGVDGILLSWFDFDDGLNRFIGDVMPLLEQRGLRQPFQPTR
jgi:alkanesulfonate monooxygenase SsuD/methylene tetrahydromethanopterin reductase-like flavin-dependent oxidoreductase (luciferase family)